MSIVMSLWTTATATTATTTTIGTQICVSRIRGGNCHFIRRGWEGWKSRCCPGRLQALYIGRSSCTSRTLHASASIMTYYDYNRYCSSSDAASDDATTAAGSLPGGRATRRKRRRAYYYYYYSSSASTSTSTSEQQKQESAQAQAQAQATSHDVRCKTKSHSQSRAPSSSSSSSPILSVLTSPHKLAERLECRRAAARTVRFRRRDYWRNDHSSLSLSPSGAASVGNHQYDRNSWSDVVNKWTSSTTTSSSSNSSSSTSLYRNVATESNTPQPSSTYQSLEDGPRLLCLDIQRFRMDLAVVGHPFENDSLGCTSHDTTAAAAAAVDSTTTSSFVPVPSIPTPSRTITSCTISKLWDVIQQHQICGFLVHWPIQPDTLKFGAACGRVIFTLEKLQTESMVNPDDRPVCLFPTTTTVPTTTSATIGLTSSPAISTMMAQKQDKWGRCAGYGRTRPVYEDDLRHLRAMFHQDDDDDDGQVHGNNDPRHHHGQYQQGQDHEDVYYYDALRGRYYGGGDGSSSSSSLSGGCSNDTDPSSPFTLFSDAPSPSDLPITTKLWDQFCATSWPSASSKSSKLHNASSFIIDGDEREASSSSSSSSRSTSWTRPSRCKIQRSSGGNRRWGRRHEIEYDDYYEEVDQAASRVTVPTKKSSKHLLVDRALRQAAQAA